MYRIQAHNLRTKHISIEWCNTMTERDDIVSRLIATGDYTRGSITFEWLARY
jgi:hypothetical protein